MSTADILVVLTVLLASPGKQNLIRKSDVIGGVLVLFVVYLTTFSLSHTVRIVAAYFSYERVLSLPVCPSVSPILLHTF
jgi:hypothetical protein